jgi:mevalonate kinase
MNFQSNGKLLITGEYLVLKGATVLAVPLVFNQSVEINKTDTPFLQWKSLEKGNPWFETKIETSLFEIIETTDSDKAIFLLELLNAASLINPAFRKKIAGATVISEMDFNREWGFGSSSSLISNIAQWAEIDPFGLHKMISLGSGYDVVTSRSEGPLLFTKKGDSYKTDKIEFNPPFKNDVYFVFLGKKQDSAKSVALFNRRKKSYKSEIRLITEITKHIAHCQHLLDFEFYLKEHEQILSSVLKKKPIKETIFNDLRGEAKSLGAWGGDFAMVTWPYGKEELLKYLEYKNLNVVFSFNELIKTW